MLGYAVRLGLFVCVLVVLVGCNTLSRVPQLLDAQITPTRLVPGDTAVITVRTEDVHGIIRRIEGVVKVDPPLPLVLKDDGISIVDGDEADAVAGDGIWSIRVDVSFQTPPGTFLLEFTAYDEDGVAIQVRDGQGHAVPLQTTLPIEIHYPEQ